MTTLRIVDSRRRRTPAFLFTAPGHQSQQQTAPADRSRRAPMLPFESQLCGSHLRFFVRSSLRGIASATPVASSASQKPSPQLLIRTESASASDITKTHPQLLTKRLCLRREAWRPSS